MAYYDLECPYCEAELDVCHDDGQGYEEGVKHEMGCHKCGKSFVFETSVSYHYEPAKADCLNDGQHEYKPTHTFPVEWTNMECRNCGSTRNMTEEEKKELIKS